MVPMIPMLVCGIPLISGMILGFGSLNGDDYKSELAAAGILFTDLMFTDEIMYAIYEGVSDGSMVYYEWSASIPRYNCAPQSGYEWLR